MINEMNYKQVLNRLSTYQKIRITQNFAIRYCLLNRYVT